MKNIRTLLVDNGSLQPAAVACLRAEAAWLTEVSGIPVEPVSVMHSDRIAASSLGGLPAEVLRGWLQRAEAEGVEGVDILPFFLGPTNALREYLPNLLAEDPVASKLYIRVAHPIGHSTEDCLQLAAAVERQWGTLQPDEAILLVDHGTPRVEVHAVRRAVAQALQARLPGRVMVDCAMECRPEPEYAFNHPLLAEAIPAVARHAAKLVVALLFLSPGRHAGPGGDVDQICREAIPEGWSFRLSSPLGGTPEVRTILRERLLGLTDSTPWLERPAGGDWKEMLGPELPVA